MNKIARALGIIESASKIFYIFAAICLCALFVLMISDVFGRFVFNSPINGAAEVGTYMIIALAFFGLGYAQFTGRHVRISLLTMHLPEKVRNVLSIVLLLLSAAFFAMMTWKTGTVAYRDWVANVIFPRTTVPLPIWWISFFASVGCALLVISLLVQVTQKICGLEKTVPK